MNKNTEKGFIPRVLEVTPMRTNKGYYKIEKACRKASLYHQFQGDVEVELAQIKKHKIADLFVFLIQLRDEYISVINYDIYLRFPYVSRVLCLTEIDPLNYNVTNHLKQYNEPKYWYWAWVYVKNQKEFNIIYKHPLIHLPFHKVNLPKCDGMITAHTNLNILCPDDLFISYMFHLDIWKNLFDYLYGNPDIISKCHKLSIMYIKREKNHFIIPPEINLSPELQNIFQSTDRVLVYREQLIDLFKIIFNDEAVLNLKQQLLNNPKFNQKIIFPTTKNHLRIKEYKSILSLLSNQKNICMLPYAYMLFITVLWQFLLKKQKGLFGQTCICDVQKIDNSLGTLTGGEIVLFATDETTILGEHERMNIYPLPELKYINGKIFDKKDFIFLKQLAQDLNIPIVLKAGMKRTCQLPELTDIYDFKKISPFVDKTIIITKRQRINIEDTTRSKKEEKRQSELFPIYNPIFEYDCICYINKLRSIQKFVLTEQEVYKTKENLNWSKIQYNIDWSNAFGEIIFPNCITIPSLQNSLDEINDDENEIFEIEFPQTTSSIDLYIQDGYTPDNNTKSSFATENNLKNQMEIFSFSNRLTNIFDDFFQLVCKDKSK